MKKSDKGYSGKEPEKFQKTKDSRYVKSRTRPCSSEPPSPSTLEIKADNLHGGRSNGTGNESFHEKESHGNDVSMTMKASSNGGVSQTQEVGLGGKGSQPKVHLVLVLNDSC